MTTARLFINGRFLTRGITGVERFALEIVRAMDHLLAAGERDIPVTLVAPEGTLPPPGLKAIEFVATGKKRGHLWEQTDLFRATQGGFLLNLAASGPLFKRNQLTVIHDAAVYRRPQNFSFAYRSWHQMLGRVLARMSRLGTVSAFSRRELAATLRVKPENILIAPNGHEHILTVAPASAIIEKLGLQNKAYLLFVGSPSPNKNLARAIQAFQSLNRADTLFVIVGSAAQGSFKNELGEMPPNVMMTGRLADGEIVSLYRNATAMIFPSLYEGFGIPPLEAMTQGCPVAASKIPAVEEVCGDAALYFDPCAVMDIAARMRDILDNAALRDSLREKGRLRLPLFSWTESARSLLWSC